MTPEDRVRAALAAYAVTVQPRPALALIQARTRTTAAPEAPGTAAKAAPLGGTTAMPTVQKHPMQLDVGDVILRNPRTWNAVRWEVMGPPVACGDQAEIPIRTEQGADAWIAVNRSGPLTVDTGPALADLSDAEQHIALAWLHDQYPDAVASALRHVRVLRAADARALKETR